MSTQPGTMPWTPCSTVRGLRSLITWFVLMASQCRTRFFDGHENPRFYSSQMHRIRIGNRILETKLRNSKGHKFWIDEGAHFLFTFLTSFDNITGPVGAHLYPIQMLLARLTDVRSWTASPSTSAMVCGRGMFFVSGNSRLTSPPSVSITPLIINGRLLDPLP